MATSPARRLTLEEIERELWDLADEIERAHAAGVDVPEEVAVAFNEYLRERGAKVDRLATMIRRLENEAAWAREESRLYAERARRKEATVARLKKFVLEIMKQFGEDRLRGASGYWTRIGGQKRVEVDSHDAIPDEFLAPPKPREPMLTVILNALKLGREVPGCRMVDGDEYVRWYG